MKPSIKNKVAVIPRPGIHIYPKEKQTEDRSKFGIDLMDAIHAVIAGMSVGNPATKESLTEDLGDTALDTYEGTVPVPSNLDDEEYWAEVNTVPKVRVNELLTLAEAFLIPFAHRLRKMGDIISVEQFREFGTLTFQVHLLVDEERQPEGVKLLPPPNNMVNWHMVKGPTVPKTDFFTSLKAKYIHALTELDSVARMKALNITPILYDNRESAKMWFTNIAKEIGALDGTVGRSIEDVSFRAYTNLCNIYARMLEVPPDITVKSVDTF